MQIQTDLTGQKFGRLRVLRRRKDGMSNVRWECLCDCGKTTVAVSGNLLKGRHRSCGCGRAGSTAFRAKTRTIVNGYAFVVDWNHHRANPHTGRVREHIIVMEKKLGRRLAKDEEVHHKNGRRADNHPRNLELWLRSQPAGARVSDLLKWAKQLLRRYKTTL